MTRILCTIFFISGASALMLETLWFRQAGLAFGNSIWASSLVLSGFMAGLALGNGLAAKEGGRCRNPVRLYGIVELVIGVTGILLVYLLPMLGELLAPLFSALSGQPWLLNPLRLLTAFLLLLIPSTAMGVTLPFLTQALAAQDPIFGRVLGRLYGWNTFGALIGVVLTEFVLVEAAGVHATAWFAGLLNFAVAAISWRIGRPVEKAQITQKQAQPTSGETTGNHTAALWRFLSAAFLSGFCLLALEVVWFRFLMLFVSGLSASFSLMLAIILSGIALGGFAASGILKRRPAVAEEGAAMAFLMGLACILTYALFPSVVKPYTQAVITRATDILQIGIPLMLPVSFLSGLFFTLIGSALRRHLSSETATTGSLTLANTTGAALGAFFGGFFFLPVFGMEHALFVIAALYGLIALLLMIKQSRISRVTYGGAVLFGIGVLIFPAGDMRKHHILVPSQRLVSPGLTAEIKEVREGLIETATYLEEQWQGQPLAYRLITNSYSMSRTDFRSRRYMKLFVYWPLAVHPDPKDALLISYGVGSTAKALTDSKSLRRIDVVDISEDILEMNHHVYADPSAHPLNDPRVRTHIEDGRYFLQTTTQRYDLITAEPPPPEIAGVVNLYTREYFQLLYDRLNEGGMVTYWLPLHAIDAMSVKGILKAFCDVFKDCSLWHGQWLDLMIVGTRNAAGPVSDEVFIRQWRDPIVSKELADLGIERPEQLGPLFIGDADYLNEITQGAPPLVDNFPKRVQRSAGPRLGLVKLMDQWVDITAAQARFAKSPLIKRLWPERIRQDSLAYFSFQDILNRHWFGLREQGLPVIADLDRVLNGSSLKTLPLWLMGSDADYQRILRLTDDAAREDPMMQMHLAMRQIADREFEAALASLSRAEADPRLKGEAFNYKIYVLTLLGRRKEAQEHVSKEMTAFLVSQEGKDGERPPLSPFWAWMKAARGIDPLAGTEAPEASGD
ncbi:MAG: fused MFS/spermidine synthase [Nitrospiria bacterium]